MSETTLTVREIGQLLGVEVIGADQGRITGGLVGGPYAMDNAVDLEAGY